MEVWWSRKAPTQTSLVVLVDWPVSPCLDDSVRAICVSGSGNYDPHTISYVLQNTDCTFVYEADKPSTQK